MCQRSRDTVLPSVEPTPVSSIQLPKTTPKTNSFPEKTLTNSRMSVNCVRKADRPRQQTANEKMGVTMWKEEGETGKKERPECESSPSFPISRFPFHRKFQAG